MDLKKLIPVISIVSVAVMILWGTLGNAWDKSWLAVFVGGILMAVVNVLGKNNNDDKKD